MVGARPHRGTQPPHADSVGARVRTVMQQEAKGFPSILLGRPGGVSRKGATQEPWVAYRRRRGPGPCVRALAISSLTRVCGSLGPDASPLDTHWWSGCPTNLNVCSKVPS